MGRGGKREEGVVFPEVAGGRSTSATGRAILADAAAAVDDGLAARIRAGGDWRRAYVAHVRDLTAATGKSADAALGAAGAGLRSMRAQMVLRRGGEERPVGEAAGAAPSHRLRTERVAGSAAPVRELAVPYRGEVLRGAGLRHRLEDWVRRGIVEPSFAEAVGRVAEHPEWLHLRGRRIAVLGAASEMGPLAPLLAWGAHVLAVDLPRPELWERILAAARAGAGALEVPVRRDGPETLAARAGLDIGRELPETRRWLEDAAANDALVLGTYAYADGGGHVQVSAAADALASDLLERRPGTALAYLATPTDAFLVGPEIVEASRRRWAGRGVKAVLQAPARRLSSGRLFTEAYREEAPGGWGVADALVPQQGPNYALAKRLQRWRGVLAAGAGHPVSFNVAPATWTRSVTRNRVLAAAYAGAGRFGVEIFRPETTRVLMAALLVHDLEHDRARAAHPELLFADAAAHGGLWRAAYEPRSVLGLAAVAGLPRALRGG